MAAGSLPSDESFTRLHRAGWSVGKVRILTPGRHSRRHAVSPTVWCPEREIGLTPRSAGPGRLPGWLSGSGRGSVRPALKNGQTPPWPHCHGDAEKGRDL
jgi:hypothetical protein